MTDFHNRIAGKQAWILKGEVPWRPQPRAHAPRVLTSVYNILRSYFPSARMRRGELVQEFRLTLA